MQHVDRLGLTRTAEMLGVRPVDMPELLAGTVQAPPAGMARVRRAAQETDDVPF